MKFRNITAGQRVKQFSNFLKDGSNKNCFIDFVVNQWKSETYLSRLNNKIMYATSGVHCYKLTANGVENVEELSSKQEEADTRLILHALHASRFQYEALILSVEDTDVCILGLTYAASLHIPIFHRCIAKKFANTSWFSCLHGLLFSQCLFK